MADGYRGVFGAFPYAFGRSESWLFRSYAAVSALLAVALSLLFGFGLVVLVARTTGVAGGSLTLSRAFFVLVGLFVVAPVIAPTLLVARRHRRPPDRDGENGRRALDDALLGAAGYLFLASLYAGLVISIPPAQQTPPSGPAASAVAFLYGLPQLWGLVPPVMAALLILAVDRTTR